MATKSDINRYKGEYRSRYNVARKASPTTAVQPRSGSPGLFALAGGPGYRTVPTDQTAASYPVPQVPTGVEPAEAETYGENVNAPAATRTEIQPTIVEQGAAPRYGTNSIMGLVSSLTGGPKANESYDPSKPIGGENVPYKAAGLFQRFLGNQANALNMQAQQAQAAKWEAEDTLAKARQAKREDLADEIRLREEGPQKRFDASQQAAKEIEAARVIAENKRLELEGKRIGLTERQIEEARQDRIARLQADKEDRDIRIENMRSQNALADAAFGRSLLPTAHAISTGQGGVLMYDPRSGQPLGTYSSPTIGEITNPDTGEKTFGPTGGGYKPYVPPVKAPVNTGGAQVNRGTGATLGGPLLDEKLPPGGGVRMGGALPSPQVTPMRAAAPSPEADASLLGRFRTAMPSLSFAQPSGRGYQVAPLTEGDVAQQAMEQIAYPLRAAAAQEAKSGFQNPEEAAYILEEKPKWRFRRAGATEMSEARKAGDVIRQMYAE